MCLGTLSCGLGGRGIDAFLVGGNNVSMGSDSGALLHFRFTDAVLLMVLLGVVYTGLLTSTTGLCCKKSIFVKDKFLRDK